jgi:hypothetical protein
MKLYKYLINIPHGQNAVDTVIGRMKNGQPPDESLLRVWAPAALAVYVTVLFPQRATCTTKSLYRTGRTLEVIN